MVFSKSLCLLFLLCINFGKVNDVLSWRLQCQAHPIPQTSKSTRRETPTATPTGELTKLFSISAQCCLAAWLGVVNQFTGTSRGSFWSVASCCSLKPRWKAPLGISFPDLKEHDWKGPNATGCENKQIQSLKVTVYGTTIPVRWS